MRVGEKSLEERRSEPEKLRCGSLETSFHCRGRGTKIPHASPPKKKKIFLNLKIKTKISTSRTAAVWGEDCCLQGLGRTRGSVGDCSKDTGWVSYSGVTFKAGSQGVWKQGVAQATVGRVA